MGHGEARTARPTRTAGHRPVVARRRRRPDHRAHGVSGFGARHPAPAERSILGELPGTDFGTMGPMRPYRAPDAPVAHRGAIGRHLFDRAMGLFGPQRTVTPYDLTNTCSGGGAERQPKARRGHSKDKRTDRPLPALGPVPGVGGFVCRSQVFAGNVREHGTPAGMSDAPGAPRGAPVVTDRGIATGERICRLREQGYRHLVVGSERARHCDAENPVRIRTAADRAVRLRKVVSDDGREARPYCLSEERAARERGIVERFAGRSGRAPAELSEGLAKPRARKRIERIRDRIGRPEARSRGPARHYAASVRFPRRPLQGSMVTHPGVCRLRTNPTDRDGATPWRTHITPTGIGAVFRSPNPNPACGPSATTSPSGPEATRPSPSSPTSPCR